MGALLCAAPLPTHAQELDKGVIVGTVTDITGASVLDATITILNPKTNAIYTLRTNSSGFYTSPSLIIGSYTVTAKKKGFEVMTEPSIIIDVGTRAQIDFVLHPGSVEAEVTVQADSPTLNTTSGVLGYVIDDRTLQDLPLNGGNALALAALLPGVTSAFGATSSGFNDRGTQLSAIRVSGGAVGANANTLDGANNQLNYLGEVGINPQADSIAQFRLITGAAPAQYGFTSGGIIDIATRSGGNKLSGTLYEFFRNDFLDARNYFASPSLPKPELRYNRFGASLSGHFIRNKLFFFANTEMYRLTQTNPTYGTVPTTLERNGDFSQSHVANTLPCTSFPGIPCTDFTPAGSTTPGSCLNVRFTFTDTVTNITYANVNQITSTAIDPAAKAIQDNFYPLPNNTQGLFNPCANTNNYLSNTKLQSSQRLIVGRIDYQITSRDGIFARYANYNNQTNNAGVFPSVVASGRIDDPINQNLTLGYTRVISPNSLNDLRLSILRADFPSHAGSFGQNWPARLGMNIPGGTTLPNLTNGVAAFNTVTGFRAATQYEITDHLTRQAGTHGFAIGTDLRYSSAYNSQNLHPSGVFSFISNTTAVSGDSFPGSGDQYASFLLGQVNQATDTVSSGTTFQNYSVSFYVQDAWRAARNLTLNLGLRYDYQQQPYEIRNRTSNFDPHRTDPANGFPGATVYSGLGGYGRTFNRENYFDFSPRFSFAWNVVKLHQMVLRGGYATYYSSTANASFAGSTNGFGSTDTIYTATTNNGSALRLQDGFLTPPTQNLGSKLGPDAFLGNGSVSYQEENQPTPMSQVFTFSVSKQFPGKWVVEVSYLGNHGIHFVQPNYNMNSLNPIYFSQGQGAVDILQQTVPNPYANLPGAKTTITNFNRLRPYPYYTAVAGYQPHTGTYFGNYMYVTSQRRVGRGTQVIASYTLGKLMSDPIYVPLSTIGGTSTGPSGSFQNPYNRGSEYTVDTIDHHQRLTVAIISQAPFGPGQLFLRKRSFLSSALSNISFNSIITMQDGTPLSITGANNETVATRPNFSGINPLSGPHHTIQHWFNPDAFVNPPNYTFGNVGRTTASLRGPGAFNLDASLMKNMKLRKVTAQLRLETFNTLNHASMSNPNTGFTATANCDVVNPALTPCAPNPLPGSGANTNGNFGVITSASGPRVIQLGIKLNY
ncbi:MAG TPA: carboxypeptidase regulatory-like domain-containing protein [Acidobacteriaceae bacterium]